VAFKFDGSVPSNKDSLDMVPLAPGLIDFCLLGPEFRCLQRRFFSLHGRRFLAPDFQPPLPRDHVADIPCMTQSFF